MYSVFELLKVQRFPFGLFLCLLFGGASALLIPLHKPWKQTFTKKSLIQISMYSLLLIFNMGFWCAGLTYFGPLRTVLVGDYSDHVFIIFMTCLTGRSSTNSTRVKGLGLIFLAYFILYFFGGNPSEEVHENKEDGTAIIVSPEISFWIFTLSERTVGAICLFISVIIGFIRTKVAKKSFGLFFARSRDKQLFAIGVFVSFLMLSPIALFETLWSVEVRNVYFWTTTITIVLAVLFLVVLDYYIEWAGRSYLKKTTLTRMSLSIGFVVALVVDVLWSWGQFHFSTFLIYACMFLAYGMLFTVRDSGLETSNDSILPTTSKPLNYGSISTDNLFALSSLKGVVAQILSDKNSRKIFGYLAINLTFMFVELLYGFWTNSLGLISDAFHMLFDCTALAIGLYASVVSKLDPNRSFTYGYGRVEVLSGFLNGIFLCFIAFTIFLKSVERLFDPPHINTDRLLLVSVLGLLVNLIGIFAFHGSHGHSHGGDSSHGHAKKDHAHSEKKKSDDHKNHSHSHSHSHGHGHNHEKKKKKQKHDDEGHSENLYGIFLHIVADTLGSVGVIISSLLIDHFGWIRSDPLCSLILSIIIFLSIRPLLSSTAKVLLQRTPERLEKTFPKIYSQICSVPGVLGCKDVHFWANTSSYVVGSIHVTVEPSANEQRIRKQIHGLLKDNKVKHITVQINKEISGINQN
eukprot:TRINITY_DN6196_c0_g1_i2.p1 TRINITY_DN6196_c0_g1~~TRINITY_DN6196_c0_g1_i2.p1  ORF type:complete len:689 (-),score=110.12 TRINITY_DN6196_c0_g1_i2:52-2118(-)